jgi:hypothetical protein
MSLPNEDRSGPGPHSPSQNRKWILRKVTQYPPSVPEPDILISRPIFVLMIGSMDF